MKRLCRGASLLWMLSGCTPSPPKPVEPPPPSASPFAVEVPKPVTDTVHKTSHSLRLDDVAAAKGIEHRYVNGARGQVMIVETIGGGTGWLDFNNDGFWDLVAGQGGDPTSSDGVQQPIDQLYQSLSGQSFIAVQFAARLADHAYSQAIACADFDEDGFDDIYVSNLTGNTLWHNLGDGTFVEVGQSAGVADTRWSVSAAWNDLDNDSDLDLYVCNYLVYDPMNPKVCRDPQGRDSLCNPGTLDPWPDACYINQGDGTFVDQAQERGLVGKNNRALGVAIADFNGDYLPDVYVANDTTENFLFINKGQGYFEDRAPLLGCAVDRAGATQASMGIAVGDYDRNGFQDLYVTNYYQESNTLYANNGSHGFQDVTALERLHQPTLAVLGFGTVMQDFDHNGQMELLVANGHVDNAPHNPVQEMTAQLFTYTGKSWTDVSASSGSYFAQKRLGRGVATADFDRDGDLDVAILNQNAPLALLENNSQPQTGVHLLLHGRRSNRHGIGAIATLTSGPVKLVSQLCAGTSYAASHQPLISFGLGQTQQPIEIELRWPSGIVQTIKNIAAGGLIEVWESP